VHGLTTADPVKLARGDGDWPELSSGSLSASTTYYVRVITTTTVSLHPTANDATNNTNAVNFTTWTEATHAPFYLCRDLPCVVHFADGTRYTFANVGIESLPTIVGAASEVHLDGNLVLRAFPATGTDTSDEGSYYTRDRATYSAPTAIGTTRLTTPMTGAWSTLTGIKSETPWKIAISPQLADVPSANIGVATKIVTGMKVTVSGKPQTIKTSDLETELSLQGSGDGVGSNLPGAAMTLTSVGGATSCVIVCTSMMLSKASLMASISNQRVGELEWVNTAQVPGTWFSVTA